MDGDKKKFYVFNLETTKIELHFDKADYTALSEELKSKLKSAFLWSGKNKCWVSRAKEPNLWRAKEIAKELGFTEEQREGERLSYAEQIVQQTECAEARADRYEGYAGNAANRGEQMQSELKSYSGDIAFFTQPNVNSSGGRAFTNRRNKIFERYGKGFEEYRKSAYFLERAEIARGTADTSQFKNKGYLDRRIKECKKTIKKREENAIYYEKILQALEAGEEKRWHGGEIVTVEEVTSLLEYQLELIEKEMDKQGYLENCLDELGGIQFSKDNIKIGYIVRIKRWGQVEITGTGPVNVGFKILTGGAAGGTLQATYAEIEEVVKAEEKERPTHPFTAGEQFEVVHRDYSGNTTKETKTMYEIVKTSKTTIQLRPVGTTEKPITRKPVKTRSSGWRFSVNDTYGNTFYKKEACA